MFHRNTLPRVQPLKAYSDCPLDPKRIVPLVSLRVSAVPRTRPQHMPHVWLASTEKCYQGDLLIPEFDESVPRCCHNLGRRVWVPLAVYGHLIVRLNFSKSLGCLPVPDDKVAVTVPANNIRAVGRHVQATGVARPQVPLEGFLCVLLVAGVGAKSHDAVVQRLQNHPLLVRMQRHLGHRAHAWIGNVLHVDGNVPFPHADALVVRGRHHASPFLDKRDRVDRTQVTIVLLHHLSRANVVAKNLLVRRPAAKKVLLVFRRMKLDAVRNFLVGEARDALARLRVPQPHHAVIPSADKLRARVVERCLAHRPRVPVKRSQHATLAIEFPQLDLLVHAAREHQVPRFGQEQYRVDTLGVSGPLVNLALWQETLCWRLTHFSFVRRRMHVRPPQVINLVFDVQHRSLGRLLLLLCSVFLCIVGVDIDFPRVKLRHLFRVWFRRALLGEIFRPWVLCLPIFTGSAVFPFALLPELLRCGKCISIKFFHGCLISNELLHRHVCRSRWIQRITEHIMTSALIFELEFRNLSSFNMTVPSILSKPSMCSRVWILRSDGWLTQLFICWVIKNRFFSRSNQSQTCVRISLWCNRRCCVCDLQRKRWCNSLILAAGTTVICDQRHRF
eukprot:m.936751 g.936751  ORF g.936751 m.936751 type:complete len:616 (+) comp23811_c0_seq5:2954-4801(+)